LNTTLQCAFCKVRDAHFDEYGVPICSYCLDAAKRKPDRKTGICSALVQNLDDATLRFEVASREVNSTIGDILSGLNAPHKLLVLWKEKERAYVRLEEYLSRGIVPEDLD
jgi:hypothetical protein